MLRPMPAARKRLAAPAPPRAAVRAVGLLLLGALAFARMAPAQVSLLIVTDDCPPVTALAAVGGFSTIDTFVTLSAATPTLAQLQAYDAVLAYSNDTPADATALGDRLADYVDSGGCLALATYLFSDDWSVEGRILTPGYAPFQKTPTGGYATPSGSLAAALPAHWIFDGVDLGTITYQSNSNMADGALDPGAILLASDGAGLNMVARAASRPITAFNVFPVGANPGDLGCTAQNNNPQFYRLLANSLLRCGSSLFADSFESGDTGAWSATLP